MDMREMKEKVAVEIKEGLRKEAIQTAESFRAYFWLGAHDVVTVAKKAIDKAYEFTGQRVRALTPPAEVKRPIAVGE
jgi:hypothetical protein